MRPGFLVVLAGALLVLSAGGVKGQALFEGSWRHNDADESKFGGGTGPVDVTRTADGGFVGKFDIRDRDECASGGNRESYIRGRFDGSLDGILAAPSVSGTMTRCTNPELVKKCKHPKTYEVPFEGVAVWLGAHPINKTLTMVIRFKVERWNIPQCKEKPPPKTVTVQYELVLPRQPQRPRPSPSSRVDDCARAALDKFLKQDPTPLAERCR